MSRPAPLRIIDGQVVWPYSVEQLRRDEPSYSIFADPSDEDLAFFQVFRPAPTPQPGIDPSNQRVVEAEPVLAKDVWTQNWVIEELSETEKKAIWRAANPPQWQAFGAALWSNPAVGAMLRGGLQTDPTAPLSMTLPLGVGQAAESGSYATFFNVTGASYNSGLLPVPLLVGIIALAEKYLLPEEFIDGMRAILQRMPLIFQPPEAPARFDEWTAPDSSRWVLDQPRDPATGEYLADNPDTPESESALRWQLVVEAPTE